MYVHTLLTSLLNISVVLIHFVLFRFSGGWRTMNQHKAVLLASPKDTQNPYLIWKCWIGMTPNSYRNVHKLSLVTLWVGVREMMFLMTVSPTVFWPLVSTLSWCLRRFPLWSLCVWAWAHEVWPKLVLAQLQHQMHRWQPGAGAFSSTAGPDV